MKKALTMIGIIVVVVSCKDDKKISEKDILKLTQKAEVNREIKNLNRKIKKTETDFQRAEIHTRIAFLQSEKGNGKAASESARTAIKFQPNQYMSHYILGKTYLQSGRYDDAEYHLKLSVTLKSEFPLSHFELGNTYYKKNKLKIASEEYLLTIKLDPDNIDAMNNIAVISNLTGNYRKAEKYLLRIIKTDPTYSTAYKNLAIINDLKFKKRNKAVQYYKKYLQLRPDCSERVLVKTWIKELGGKI